MIFAGFTMHLRIYNIIYILENYSSEEIYDLNIFIHAISVKIGTLELTKHYWILLISPDIDSFNYDYYYYLQFNVLPKLSSDN